MKAAPANVSISSAFPILARILLADRSDQFCGVNDKLNRADRLGRSSETFDTMKVGYARIGSDERSLAEQERLLRNAGCERLYRDDDPFAPIADAMLQACIDSLQPGDLLVTTRLDRLAHSFAGLVEVLDDLSQRGIGFRSLHEGIDTTSEDGALVARVIGTLAEFQRTLTSEKTRAGMAAAQARGRHVGRPPSLDDAQLAAAARALEREGASLATVAPQFGVHPRTLSRLLKRQQRPPGEAPAPERLTTAADNG